MVSKRTWRVLAVVLASLVGLLATAAVVLWFALPSIVLGRVEAEAAKRGLELSKCELLLGYPLLRLDGCHFEVAQAKQLTGRIERLAITLQGLQPASVKATGVHSKIQGAPEFDNLFEQRERILDESIPLEMTESTLAVHLTDAPEPTLRVSALEYRIPGGDFKGNVEITGHLAGTVSKSAELVQLSLAPVKDPSSKLEIRVSQAQALGELRLEFQRFALERLLDVGVKLPEDLAKVSVDGQVYAQIPIGLNPAPGKGDVRLTLHGLNFPVPRELSGLVYGTDAELSSNFTLDRSFTKAELKKTTFKVGALEMKGQGKLVLNGFAVDFELGLNGRLTCEAIVRSAVLAHAGSELSRIAGIIAQRALKGSVELIAKISGSTSALDQVSVLKTVGLGCGLKPLPLEGLPGLPSPEDVMGRLKELPGELDKRLPKDPGPSPDDPPLRLPKLPSLPGFPKDKKLQDPPQPEPGKSKPKPEPSPAPPAKSN